jgi:hypothetical protein
VSFLRKRESRDWTFVNKRGHWRPIRKSAASRETFGGYETRHANRPGTAPSPDLSPESDKGSRFGGEEKIYWNADPGLREWLLPLACPGLQF